MKGKPKRKAPIASHERYLMRPSSSFVSIFPIELKNNMPVARYISKQALRTEFQKSLRSTLLMIVLQQPGQTGKTTYLQQTTRRMTATKKMKTKSSVRTFMSKLVPKNLLVRPREAGSS